MVKRFVLSLLLMAPGVAQAQVDPRITQCSKVEQDYGQEMVHFYRLLEQNSTDRGGRIDPSLITDIYFALVEGKQFVHKEIQKIQRVGVDGGQPSVAACRTVRAVARAQIEQYARYLLSEVDPRDRGLREAARDEFRMGLYESSSAYQGY